MPVGLLNVFAEALYKRASEKISEDEIFDSAGDVFKRAEGSYSDVATIASVGLLAFRDPHGIKPLVFGRRGNSFAFASYK